MPPIEWPTSTTGVSPGAVAIKHLVQVGTELVDADQVGIGPARPAVAALVPEHAPGGWR